MPKREVLVAAVTKAGGVGALAERLNVRERVLLRYLEGDEPIPDALFLLVVDVIQDGSPPSA